jgi:peptidoglycan/xylan/chitin deacetylase (PgdA/CDA1 family)
MRTLSFLIAGCLALASLAHASATAVPVLMYHQITDHKEPGDTVVPLAKFAQQMEYLASQNYDTLSMDELVAVMRGRKAMPPKPVVVTFDDGWRNVLAAVPILDKHRFKASFWIISGMTADPQYLGWPEIKALARNPRFEIQSHTRTHPWDPSSNLLTWAEGKTPGKSMADVRGELVDSKRELEAQLGRRIDYLAWPLGLYNDSMVELAVSVGYKAMLTTEDGMQNRVGADVLRIRRLGVNGLCDLSVFIAQLADHLDRHGCR